MSDQRVTVGGAVPTFADLPPNGNDVGDTRWVLTPPEVGAPPAAYQWNGTLWIRLSPILTSEGGLGIPMTNNTLVALAKGSIVHSDSTNDDSIDLCPAGGDDPIGVLYETTPSTNIGIVIIAGFADFLVDDVGAVARDSRLGVSSVSPGVCSSALGSGIPEHFRETGHTTQSRVGPGLVRGIVHMN